MLACHPGASPGNRPPTTDLLTPRRLFPDAVVASAPRVIINNSVYKHKQRRDQVETTFESPSHPPHFPRNPRPPPRVVQPNPPDTTMCVKEIFTDVRPDGRTRNWVEGDYCHRSVRGQFCERTQELRHPPGYRRSESRVPTYGHGQLPPTPPLSYHSDYTSDSDRSSKRRSGSYINDHNIVEVGRRRSSRHKRDGSGDRLVYLGSSPLSRTPPLYPSSPVADVYDTYEANYRDVNDRERSRERPPSVHVEIINERPKGHRRQGSSKTSSSGEERIHRRQSVSKTSSSEEERRHRRSSSVHYGDQHRQRSKKETEIARQNEAIANRIPVPHVPASPRYRRGSVSIVPPVAVQERLRMQEEEALEREHEREIEAQRRRLKDRFEFKPYR